MSGLSRLVSFFFLSHFSNPKKKRKLVLIVIIYYFFFQDYCMAWLFVCEITLSKHIQVKKLIFLDISRDQCESYFFFFLNTER